MARKSDYPLDALQKKRAVETRAAEELLRDRNASEQQAEDREARAREQLDRHRQQSKKFAHERKELRPRSVADLAREGAYADRRARDEADLQQGAEEARRTLETARLETERTRQELAESRAREKTVQKHRAKWESQERRGRERAQEDALDELSASRFPGRKLKEH